MTQPNDIIRGERPRPPTHTMSVNFTVQGGHTHLRIWTGPVGRGRGLAGNLVMTNEEFEAWKDGRLQIVFSEAP